MKNDALKMIAQKAKRRLVGKEMTPANTKIKVIASEDVEFKNKVEFLLSQKEVVTNPVHYLVDDKVMKNMDEVTRERYLLSTLDKYTALRNELENISSNSRFCM